MHLHKSQMGTLTFSSHTAILLLVLPSIMNAFQISSILSNNRIFHASLQHSLPPPTASDTKSHHMKNENHEHQTCNSKRSKNHPDHQSGNTMILPIFPLRKRVKFPTESIQLTLWEERYKSLAQNVLNQSQSQDMNQPTDQFHTFGIVYASHKPQIIKDGNAPITPLIEPGDVGVLCVVKSYALFKDNVQKVGRNKFPTTYFDSSGSNFNDSGDNSKYHDHLIVKDINDWNKIRLIGLGIERFFVEDIIQNGYQNDHGSSGESSFILVKARKLCDDIEKMNLKPSEKSLKNILQLKEIIENKLFGRSSSVGEDLNYLMEDLKEFQDVQKEEYLGSIGNTDTEFGSDETEKIVLLKSVEDWSFAILSTLEANCPALDMIKMLSCTSLEERLKYIASNI